MVIEINRNTIERQRKERINANVIKIPGFNSGELGFVKIFSPTIRKAIDKAKLSVVPVLRGCGSGECGCGHTHSIPFKIDGNKSSSFTGIGEKSYYQK